MMVCTDPSLFGWPMLMYGSLQSPRGSILWNGSNTGGRIQSSESDWWFEDISYLSVNLFEKLIKTMEVRGIRPKNTTGAIMYYCRKYLPGLDQWQGVQGGKTSTVTSFCLTPAAVDQRVLLESIEKLLPEKKGKAFCRVLLGLVHVALILNVNQTCMDSLERRIGMQLELATLDSLLIPNYLDCDVLYNTDCIEKIIHHFVSSESNITSFSPQSLDLQASPSSESLRKVAKMIDSYIAEIASDVNLKPMKIRSLAEALPEYILGSQIKRKKSYIVSLTIKNSQSMPLQLRTALAGCHHALESEIAPVGPVTIPNDTVGEIVQMDGWVTMVHENKF
ncbi:hypothetical protein RJT34_07456 [Clitoria ternatea]|uniref:NPH3 domain-containing protein n=1 Tax=Clitoria ternatea TaxID=43366 RepID=A0AAN9PTI9_CLITE